MEHAVSLNCNEFLPQEIDNEKVEDILKELLLLKDEKTFTKFSICDSISKFKKNHFANYYYFLFLQMFIFILFIVSCLVFYQIIRNYDLANLKQMTFWTQNKNIFQKTIYNGVSSNLGIY